MSDIRKKMWEAMSRSPFIMIGLNNNGGHREPMTAQLDKDANHAFWIYTTADNRIAAGGPAMVQYASKGHDLFACIGGTLVAETDPVIFDRFWSKHVAAWYPGGRNDPNLRLMRFNLDDAEVWAVDASLAGKLTLLTGGKVDPEKMGDHAKLKL